MNSTACAVAQRDGAGLIQQQRVDVARRFHRFAAHGQHVVLHHAIHAGDADGRKQSADGGGDQANQQRDQHGDRGHSARRRWRPRRRAANGCSVATASRKISVKPGDQNVQRDFVRRLLPLRAFDQRDHRSRNVSPGLDVMRILT